MPQSHTPLTGCADRQAVPKSASPRLGLAVLLLGGFITVFDLFVVNVAIPSMEVDLGASFADIGFVVAGYALSFGMFLIAGGRLGDIHGRRRLFTLGVLGFGATSFLCGVAPGAASLIIARFAQGATGAMLFPQVYALLRVMFDDAERRRAFGLLGMTLGLAAIAGQVLGGLVIDWNVFGLGWRIVFLVNLPISVIAALLSRFIPESRVPEAARVDWLGIGLAMLGLLLLLVPLLEGQNTGWPAWCWGCFVVAVPVFGVFVSWERRLARRGGVPTIEFRLFANPGFMLGAVVVLLIYSASTSLFLCFALLVQSGFGLSPFEAGSLFAPASVGFVAASLLTPKLVARGGNVAVAGGALIYAAGIGWLIVTVSALESARDLLTLVPPLVLFGLGQGASMTPLINLVIGFVEEGQAGMAAGVISTMQQVGGAFGVSIVGIFFSGILGAQSSETGPTAIRYVDAFAGAMLYNLSAVIVAAALIVWIGRKPTSPTS